MTAEAKDAISHRGRAFRALTPFITAACKAPDPSDLSLTPRALGPMHW